MASYCHLPPAKPAEFLLRHANDCSRVHLYGSIIDLFIVNPIVSVIEAPKQQNGQFSPLRLGEADDRFSNFGERAHGFKLHCPSQNSSPIFWPNV